VPKGQHPCGFRVARDEITMKIDDAWQELQTPVQPDAPLECAGRQGYRRRVA
jgi:hypothetical protein